MADRDPIIDETPPFWWRGAGWQAWALSPASLLYGWLAARRLRGRGRLSFELPVIRLASLAIGSAGCTEAAIALAAAARRLGMRPGIAASGPSGAYASPHMVARDGDLPKHVGDEALLLARAAPTALCADRVAAARALAAEGVDLVIVANGEAAERLRADFTLAVIEASRGVGNGYVTPAGPVRAPLVDQLRHASALLKIGRGDAADRVVRMAARAGRPLHEAAIRPRRGTDLSGRRWLAFAGVADPAQFFDMVRAARGEIEIARTFAGGHIYAEDELHDLAEAAEAGGLSVVTTTRDAERLHHGSEAARALRRQAVALETELAFEFRQVPEAIVAEAVETFRLRQFR
jgi:tetraacyldisaccharide 4'-kinase